MSLRLDGYWVKKSHLWESVKLAKMYTWRHHSVMHAVADKFAEHRANGGRGFDFEKNVYPGIVEAYQADPDFVEIQVFDRHSKFFIRWIDHMSGFRTSEMVKELMLPWKHVWYDGRVGEGSISTNRAWEIEKWFDEGVNNGMYFVIPILQRRDPTRAHIFDIWPPMIKDLRRVGEMMHDGMDMAPIPVFVDYRKEG